MAAAGDFASCFQLFHPDFRNVTRSASGNHRARKVQLEELVDRSRKVRQQEIMMVRTNPGRFENQRSATCPPRRLGVIPFIADHK